MHDLTHYLPGLAVTAILAACILACRLYLWSQRPTEWEQDEADRLGIEGECLHVPTPWIVRLWRWLRTPSTVDCRQCQREPGRDRCGRCVQ